jgi:glycosyltransferase involved in cell wall biosynthesis
MSTISLCMIVKDEELMLPGCLESVKDWVDEMIVVDTGSTDKTKEIAQEAGAKVFDFEWINDFSAARNHAKEQATGDFILVLDADERLAPEDGAILREQIELLTFQTVVFVTLMNSTSRFSPLAAVVEGSERAGSPVLLPRIVVNKPTMKWVGRIHESPLINDAELGRININIIHVGADQEWRESRQKGERNLTMLMESLNEDENKEKTALFWSYMATEMLNAGHRDEFHEALKKSWDRLKEAINNRIIVNTGVAPLYPSVLILRGQFTEGLEALHFLIKNFKFASTNPANLLYQSADALSMIEYPEDAKQGTLNIIAEVSDLLVEMDGEAFIDETLWGVTNIKAHMLKAYASMKLGNFEDSYAAIQKGFDINPEHEALHLLNIECHLEEGNVPKSLSLMMDRLNLNENMGPDIWVLASTACLALGNEDDSSIFLDQAMLRSKLPFVRMHRQRLLHGLSTRRDVLNGNPRSGKGAYGVLGAILSREPVIAFNNVPNDIIKKVCYSLLTIGKTELIERFFDARSQQILPGIKEQVIEILEEIGVEVVDDGEVDPVFLLGDGLEALTAIFEQGNEFSVVHLGAEYSQLVLDKWLEHETEKSEAFLFGDLSFLDDDDEDEDDTEAMTAIRAELRSTLRGKRQDNNRLIVVLQNIESCYEQIAEILPKSYFLFHLEDPRTTAMKAQIVSSDKVEKLSVEWTSRLEAFDSIHLIDNNRYVGLNNSLIKEDPSLVLSRLFACIGENWKEDFVDIWNHNSKDNWENSLSEEVIEAIENKLGESMVAWNIPFEQKEVEA